MFSFSALKKRLLQAAEKPVSNWFYSINGAKRIRTADPLHAMQVLLHPKQLSQLIQRRSIRLFRAKMPECRKL